MKSCPRVPCGRLSRCSNLVSFPRGADFPVCDAGIPAGVLPRPLDAPNEPNPTPTPQPDPFTPEPLLDETNPIPPEVSQNEALADPPSSRPQLIPATPDVLSGAPAATFPLGYLVSRPSGS